MVLSPSLVRSYPGLSNMLTVQHMLFLFILNRKTSAVFTSKVNSGISSSLILPRLVALSRAPSLLKMRSTPGPSIGFCQQDLTIVRSLLRTPFTAFSVAWVILIQSRSMRYLFVQPGHRALLWPKRIRVQNKRYCLPGTRVIKLFPLEGMA